MHHIVAGVERNFHREKGRLLIFSTTVINALKKTIQLAPIMIKRNRYVFSSIGEYTTINIFFCVDVIELVEIFVVALSTQSTIFADL